MADKTEWAVELEDDVTPGAKKATRSLDRLQSAFQKFSKSAGGKAVAKFAGWAKDVVTIGAAVGAGVAAGITSMTVEMIDFNQRSKAGFKALAKAGEDPQKSFQRTVDLVKQFGFDLQDTTAAVLQFRASGFSQDDSERLIKMGADMRVLGANSEQVGRAFLAINQIKSAGTLQGDELNQLAEAGVPKAAVFEELAKAMGKTVPQILKLKEAGQIGADDAINAIGKAMLRLSGGKTFGEAGEKIANQTLSGMSGRLKAGFDDMFRRAAIASEGPVSKAFGPLASKLLALFDDPRAAAGIADLVTGIAGAFEQALPFVEVFVTAFGSGFMEAFDALRGGFGIVVDALASFGIGGGNAANIVRMIGTTVGQLAAIVGGTFVAAVAIAGVAITGITAVFNFWKTMLGSVVNAIGAVIFGVTDFFANLDAIAAQQGISIGEKFFQIGAAIVQGVVNGIKSLASAPVELLKTLGGGWITAVKSVLGIASPSKVFAEIGQNTALGFQQGVEGDMPTVGGVAATLGASPGAGLMGGQAGGGQYVFAPAITVPLSGSATRADGEAFAGGLSDELERQFMRFLEGAALEMGV